MTDRNLNKVFRFKCDEPSIDDMFDESVFIDLFDFLDTILDFVDSKLDRISAGLFDLDDISECFMGIVRTNIEEYPLYLPTHSYEKALTKATEVFVDREMYEEAHRAKILLDKIEELKLEQYD
jgi:hypothetical protein